MNKKLLMLISGIVVGFLLVISPACSDGKPKTSTVPGFEVISLKVTPSEVIDGDRVDIMAQVKNQDDKDGVYNAILTIDGVEVEKKSITVASGATENVTFSLLKEKPGNYKITLGGASSTLTVKEKVVAKEVEFKYDDGEARDYIAASVDYGYIVDFLPSAKPFIIKKVRLFGTLAGSDWEGKEFILAIWDKDSKVLFTSRYPVTKFGFDRPKWIEIEIPSLEVSDKFYVHIYTGTERREGIHIGADDSSLNEHSNMTIKQADGTFRISEKWPYSASYWFGDKSKVNWMIRVMGTIPPSSTPTISLFTDFSWKGKYLGEEIQFTNRSENANSWLWDFGDGSTSNEKEPRHSYKSVGIYSVGLEVKNIPGESAKKTKEVAIFKKGEVCLLKIAVPLETIKPATPYSAVINFLADDGLEILDAYFYWDSEGLIGPIKVRNLTYGPPGIFTCYLQTNNPGVYKLRVFVKYKSSGGEVKQSNEVNTTIRVL